MHWWMLAVILASGTLYAQEASQPLLRVRPGVALP